MCSLQLKKLFLQQGYLLWVVMKWQWWTINPRLAFRLTLPMLEIINELIKFDQNLDTFVSDFEGAMKSIVQISIIILWFKEKLHWFEVQVYHKPYGLYKWWVINNLVDWCNHSYLGCHFLFPRPLVTNPL